MVDISKYMALVPSEHQKPKFLSAVSASVQPLVDAQNIALMLQTLFDLDSAVGQQLDMTGQWIGVSRIITEPLQLPYFAWDTPGLGWDQAPWYAAAPFTPPPAQIVALDDVHYRILLKARVAANVWDGTIPGAYSAWETLFQTEGFQILIQNVGAKTIPWFQWDVASAGWDESAWAVPGWSPQASDNMHIILSIVGPPLDALTQALFTGGYIDLKAAGVTIDAYATQSVPGVPMFAWDVGPTAGLPTCPPTNLAGWDMGAWAIMTPGG